jgi:hypothetical protein
MEARALTGEPEPELRGERLRAVARRRRLERAGASLDDELVYLDARMWAELARDQAAELVELEREQDEHYRELEREQLLELLRDTDPRAP